MRAAAEVSGLGVSWQIDPVLTDLLPPVNPKPQTSNPKALNPKPSGFWVLSGEMRSDPWGGVDDSNETSAESVEIRGLSNLKRLNTVA